jgi:hypothetical protein
MESLKISPGHQKLLCVVGTGSASVEMSLLRDVDAQSLGQTFPATSDAIAKESEAAKAEMGEKRNETRPAGASFDAFRCEQRA